MRLDWRGFLRGVWGKVCIFEMVFCGVFCGGYVVSCGVFGGGFRRAKIFHFSGIYFFQAVYRSTFAGRRRAAMVIRPAS